MFRATMGAFLITLVSLTVVIWFTQAMRDFDLITSQRQTVRGRFDQSTWTPQRLEVETRANFDRWTLQFLYGDYAPQPLLGFLTRREGFLTGASLKVTANWVLLGSTRYDIENDRFDQARLGVGYVDDCFMLSVNWLSSYTYTTVALPVRNDTVMLQFSLRTLGPDALAPVGVSY